MNPPNVSYCINPKCQNRLNPDQLDICQSCGTPLLIKNRYRLIKPLRQLDPRSYTELWEIDDQGGTKVLKVLKENSPKLVDLFEQEAAVLQFLKHPGIPQVGIDGNFTFTPNNSTEKLYCLVMDKIEGQNLEDWVKQHGSISQKTAIAWLKEITDILGYLHENGLFHRDIKPSNIMLTPQGQLVLIDFGSAREISYTYLAKLNELFDRTEIISSGYTPLEQVKGKAVPQSDFYALGRTFVYLLTGKRPNEFPDNLKTGELIWEDQAPQISIWFAELINDMMAPFPGKRPQTTEIILQRLNPSNWLMLILLRLSKKQKLGLGVGLLLMSSLFILLIFAPSIASLLNRKGYENYQNREYSNAEFLLKLALKFNPNFNPARYNLGVVCQEKEDLDCARTQYEIVMQDRSDPPTSSSALSNLSRLYIRDKQYDKAIQLLKQALGNTEDPEIKAALHRNLGWAYFKLKRYPEAQWHLQTAIKLSGDRALPYCLLAQVQEAQKNQQGALKFWQSCLTKIDDRNLDEVAWEALARQRLEEQGIWVN